MKVGAAPERRDGRGEERDKSTTEARDEERLKNRETEWRRGVKRGISWQSGRRTDKDVRSGSWRRGRRGDAGRGASRGRREGGGRFIWSFIRGSETEERGTGSRTKAIRGFSGGGTCGQKSISPPSVSTQQTQYQQHP